jgi:uncharacterized Rmd1/YagE family protein
VAIDDSTQLRARAWLLGTRLDLKRLEGSRIAPLGLGEPLALAPLTLRAGSGGCAILLRFGAAVFFGVAPEEETRFLDSIRDFVSDPLDHPEREEAEIRIDPEAAERVAPSGEVSLRDARVERLQVVADVLAKSTVLAFYEERVAGVLRSGRGPGRRAANRRAQARARPRAAARDRERPRDPGPDGGPGRGRREA